jgi:hypothetical protein
MFSFNKIERFLSNIVLRFRATLWRRRHNVENNMEQQQDRYGNLVSIRQYTDGSCEKTTRTNENSRFEFLDDVYSLDILRRNKDVKVYWRSYSSDAVLQRDVYGRLLLYFYDDWVADDRTDRLWVVVADEADADKMIKEPRLSRLRTPFIAGDGRGWMATSEFIG